MLFILVRNRGGNLTGRKTAREWLCIDSVKARILFIEALGHDTKNGFGRLGKHGLDATKLLIADPTDWDSPAAMILRWKASFPAWKDRIQSLGNGLRLRTWDVIAAEICRPSYNSPDLSNAHLSLYFFVA